MTRIRFAPAVALLASVLVAPPAFAQAAKKSGAPTSTQAPATKAVAPAPAAAQAPAAPTKWVKPIKGIAQVEVIQVSSKRIGDEIVDVLKVKNMSDGSIALLKIDEYWYDKSRKVATGDTQRYLKPFNPGDVIEMTLRSPFKPGLVQSQFQFSHANGDMKAKTVKKFE